MPAGLTTIAVDASHAEVSAGDRAGILGRHRLWKVAPVRDHDPRLLLFLARHCLVGIAAGWMFLGALLSLNVAGLGELLFASEHRLLALLLVAAGFAGTFGSLAMGTAIFLLPKK